MSDYHWLKSLKAANSIIIPLLDFIVLVPLIQPRLYSISSASVILQNSVHLTIAIVDQPSKDPSIQPEHYVGYTSRFLCTLRVGSKFAGFPRHHGSQFYLPRENRPIVMVGGGTGVAPFRGFLQHRQYLQSNGEVLCPSILIFGCRNAYLDELYKDEFNGFVQSGVLTHYFPAYSRPTVGAKTYVQDRILSPECKSLIWELWNNQNGLFYVCGDGAGMAKGVNESMAKIAAEQLFNNDLVQGKEFIAKAISDNKYLQDIWA